MNAEFADTETAGTRRHLRAARWVWLPVLVPTALLALAGRFDGLYGQDPFAYYDYAVGPLRQSLLRLEPPPPFFWPPGYPFLVALVSLIVGETPLAGQVVSLASGSLVPLFTLLLAREVWGDGEPCPGLVPAVAGSVAAFTGQLWQSSAVVMADTAGLAAATLGVTFLARYGRRGRLADLVVAASALAGATLCRWIYALVAVPCALYALSAVLRRQRGRQALLHVGAPALVVGLLLGPLVVPAAQALTGSSSGLAPFAGDLQVYTWHPGNALRREFVTVDGHLRYRFPNGLYYALAPAHPFFFTPLLASFLVPGVWALVRRPTPARLWLILGWAGVVYAFHAGAPWQNFRFTLAYLPPLAVVAAVGIAVVGERLGFRAVMAILAVGLVLMGVGGVRLSNRFIARKQADLELVRWVEAHVEPGARLITFEMTLTFRHYSALETWELFTLTPEELAALVADGRPTFLLLHVARVEAQWRDLAPGVNYRRLREGPGLVRLGERRGYVLFRVGKPAGEGQGEGTWLRQRCGGEGGRAPAQGRPCAA